MGNHRLDWIVAACSCSGDRRQRWGNHMGVALDDLAYNSNARDHDRATVAMAKPERMIDTEIPHVWMGD
jgi:hypothetical protein